jgi:4-amino-4-deoxy-L-arabinose transferase-like glycosyltransferase
MPFLQHIVKKEFLLVTLFFLLGLFLRLYHLSSIPVGFHADEANIGYNAYSLLKTAHDKNGTFLPLAVDEFGDFRPSGYHYVDIIPILLFGLNEFSTRLPSAIFGSLCIIVFFFLLKELFTKRIAFFAVLLLAVSPWHIVTSRATSESIIAMFFILLSIYYFLLFQKMEKVSFLIFSFFAAFVSFLFYHVARFFVPAFYTSVILFLFCIKTKRNIIKKSVIFCTAIIITSLSIIALGSGTTRPLAISIFNAPQTNNLLHEQIAEDGGQNILLTRIFHNKGQNYLSVFLGNYFQYFSGDFLFIKGGLPKRYIVPWSGNMYLIEAPFLIVGLSFLIVEFIKNRKLSYGIPFLWLFLGPIPGAFTFEDIPNIQRTIMMLPALLTITALGIDISLTYIFKKQKKIFLTVIGIIFIYNITSFLHNYFHHSFTFQPWYRSYGEKELVTAVSTYSHLYPQVITTSQNDNNLIFYLFYQKTSPPYFQSLGSPRDKDGLTFKNILFTYAHCPLNAAKNSPANGKLNTIYVNLGECLIPTNAKVLQTIMLPDNTVAFRLLLLSSLSR